MSDSGSFVRGCAGFALGAAVGLLSSDLWFLSTMEAFDVAPRQAFHVGYWFFFVALVGIVTFVHALGRLVFRSRRGVAAATLTGVMSTLALHLPRDAAYEAMCAPICSGRQDAWLYVLAIAFAGALLNRSGSGQCAPTMDAGPPQRRSIASWAFGVAVLAILALPVFVLVYHAWYERVSVQQYAECLSLPVPTKLGILDKRFGTGQRGQIVEHGDFKGHVDYGFEPNPDYSFALSTNLSAKVVPGTDHVVEIFCGEGW